MPRLDSLYYNRSTPLGQALVWGGYPGLQLTEQVSGSPWRGFGVSGDQLQFTTPRGPGAQSSNNNTGGWYAPQNNRLRALTNRHTMVWIGVLIDSSSNFGSFICVPYYAGSWASPFGSLQLRSGNMAGLKRLSLIRVSTAAAQVTISCFATVMSLGPELQMYAISSNGASCSWYKNGLLVEAGTGSGGNTNADPPLFNAVADVCIQNHSSYDPGEGHTSNTFFAGIFNRDLTPGEIFDLWIDAQSLWATKGHYLNSAGAGGQTVSASAIASAEAFGTDQLNFEILGTGIATAEAFGAAVVSFLITGTGISSLEAFGTPEIDLTLLMTSVATLETFGSATVQADQSITCTAIAPTEAFGTAQLNFTLSATGIGTAEAFGTTQLNLSLTMSGVATAEAFGTAQLNLGLTMTAIASGEAFGTAQANLTIFSVKFAKFGTDKGANLTISGDVVINNVNFVNHSARADLFRSSGDLFYQVTQGVPTGNGFVGVGNASATVSGAVGVDANGWAYDSGGGKNNAGANVYGAAWDTAGDVVGVRLAFNGAGVGTLTFYKLVTGAWVSQGVAFNNLPAGSYAPMVSPGLFAARNLIVNFGFTPFAATPPAGTEAWVDLASVISSQEAFGTAKMNLSLLVTGIATGEAFGSAVVINTQQVLPSGIATVEAFGTAQLNFVLLAVGISSTEAFGTTVLTTGNSIVADGIPSDEAFGTAQLNFVLLGSGIASSETFGTAEMLQAGMLLATGIASAEAFGTALLNFLLSPTGITSAETFGTAQLNFLLSPPAIATTEAVGTPQVNFTLLPAGIATQEAFGTAQLNVLILPAGITSQEAVSNPTLVSSLLATAIGSQEAFGTAQLVNALQLIPASIASLEQFGVPGLTLYITPAGIASAEVVSSPLVTRLLVVEGIASAEAFGAVVLTLAEFIANYNLDWLLVAQVFDFSMVATKFDFSLKKKT